MSHRAILIVLVLQIVVGASRASDEINSEASRSLHEKMRLRTFGEMIGHLFDDRVQAEMKLDFATRQRLEDLSIRFHRGNKTLAKEIEAAAMGDPQKRLAASAALTKEHHAKYDAELREILTMDQIERVQQAWVQARGSEALRDPEIAQWLELTEAQRKRIQAVHQLRSRKMIELHQEWKKIDDMSRAAEFNDRAQQINNERNQNALDVLTSEQRKKYDELIGRPLPPRKKSNAPKQDA